MGFYATTNGSKIESGVVELVADTLADLDAINIKSISPGSSCIILETAQVFILNTKKEWISL